MLKIKEEIFMKKIKQFIIKNGGLLAALALTIGVFSATGASCLWFNQPEVPEALNSYRK
ncbi:MAG: cyclic lactone autoinducer peptide [Clostridiales bacterium]|nr:cyclic lactone autoinducer peptide [Clostridiales bacterium]